MNRPVTEEDEASMTASSTEPQARTHRRDAAGLRVGEIVIDISRQQPDSTRARWHLPSSTLAAAAARRLIQDALITWNLTELCDTAKLLVSELVTNALCHAQGPIEISLCVRDGVLRCEVADATAVVPRAPRLPDPMDDGEGGRGLWLIDTLAPRWGGTRTPTGKIMWFELAVPTH